MIVFLVFGILFMVVAIVLFLTDADKKDIKPSIALIFYAIGMLNILIYSNCDTRPSPMDVYRGKTELRITYEGKNPVDSTVIYKKGGEE